MTGKINVVISDTHCGSDRAVFPPVIELPPLTDDEDSRTLRYTRNQEKLFTHLMDCAHLVRDEFKDYQKVIIHNGDAIEGIHHHTIQLSAPMVSDHVLIHQEVMETFLQEIGFSVKNGDELYYGSGTETHTGFSEASIAKYFEPYGAMFYDELKLKQNGKNIWFVHQWKGAGDGYNEGGAIHNGLKSMLTNSRREGWDMPDLVVASHYHKATLASYTESWQTYYGMITPSFQMKTRFAKKVSAFQRNDVGVGLIETMPNMPIKIYPPLLLK